MYLVLLLGIAFQVTVMFVVQSKEEQYRYPLWAGWAGIAVYIGYSYLFLSKYDAGINTSIILLLVSVYITVALIDYWTYLIPNRLSLLSFLIALTFLVANLGVAKIALIGSASFLLLFIVLYILSMGNFGMGDVKLSASMGMMLGIGALAEFALWTFLSAAVVSIVLLLLKKKKKEDKIAFGPYMVLAYMGLILL